MENEHMNSTLDVKAHQVAPVWPTGTLGPSEPATVTFQPAIELTPLYATQTGATVRKPTAADITNFFYDRESKT